LFWAWLACTRHARRLDPPHRVATAEIEADLGKAGLQLVLTTDVFDLDFRFLTTERQQVDLADRADRGEAVAHLHPLAETVDRNCDRKACRLVRPGTPF